MKLNYTRTFIVGLAFLSICAFWQMYNNVIPLILTNTFHMNETLSGMIMAADNVLFPDGFEIVCKKKCNFVASFYLTISLYYDLWTMR